MKRKFFLKRFAVYFFAFFIPTFLLFVIAMVVFGRNAEQRLISQEQKEEMWRSEEHTSELQSR